MSFALTFAVAVAITNGAVLQSPLWSVGPYREATDPQGSIRFACLDLQGVPVRPYEEWSAAFDQGWTVGYEERLTDDWTAFGAARAFVRLAGVEAVRAALAQLELGTRETQPMAEPSLVACSS